MNYISEIIRFVKRCVVKPGERPLMVKAGALKGVTMGIDPACKFQRVFGLDEAELQPFFRKFCREARSFVDIGASDGYYPLMVANLNAKIKIVAVEPDQERVPKIRENFELNKLFGDVDLAVVSKFVGNADGGECISLDELTQSLAEPIFLKIDVDGPEAEILKAGRSALQAKEFRIIVETHSKELEDGCLALLSDLGYQTQVIKNAWWRIFVPELRPIPHNRWLVAWK